MAGTEPRLSSKPLRLSRNEILAHRLRVGSLHTRQPRTADELRHAGWAGFRDSMPRAALFSIHARVEGTTPSSLGHPSLAQVWGPGFSVYVVPESDVAPFTLGRLPESGPRRQAAFELERRLRDLLGASEMSYADAGRELGENPNRLRYATLTGGIRLRWDGARRPTIRVVPPPDVDPVDARSDLLMRYLHVFGYGTVEGFSGWAGMSTSMGACAFEKVEQSVVAARTPVGDAWVLGSDVDLMKFEGERSDSVRLLPSGDTYYLLWGDDRELLVPDDKNRSELWTSRCGPERSWWDERSWEPGVGRRRPSMSTPGVASLPPNGSRSKPKPPFCPSPDSTPAGRWWSAGREPGTRDRTPASAPGSGRVRLPGLRFCGRRSNG